MDDLICYIKNLIRRANFKYKLGPSRYYVNMVGFNEATIEKYIGAQEKADQITDKICVKELEDPFKG